MSQGDLDDRGYVILSGAAEAWRSAESTETLLARLGPGDWFGEMPLPNETRRGATVRGASSVDALSLRKREFTVRAANLNALHRGLKRGMETGGGRMVPSR